MSSAQISPGANPAVDDWHSNPLSTLSTAICGGCGQAFEPRRRNQRHCRPACRVLAHARRVEEHAASCFWEPDPGRPE